MKRVYVKANRWHGNPPTEDGRSEGIILNISAGVLGSERIVEVELSYEEWGKVLAGLGGTAVLRG